MSNRIDQLADRAYSLAQRKQMAIIVTGDGPMLTGTNTREYRRAKPNAIVGVYNKHVEFGWILEDLTEALNARVQPNT